MGAVHIWIAAKLASVADSAHHLNEFLADVVEGFITLECYVTSSHSLRGRGVLDCDRQTKYGTQTLYLWDDVIGYSLHTVSIVTMMSYLGSYLEGAVWGIGKRSEITSDSFGIGSHNV